MTLSVEVTVSSAASNMVVDLMYVGLGDELVSGDTSFVVKVHVVGGGDPSLCDVLPSPVLSLCESL